LSNAFDDGASPTLGRAASTDQAGNQESMNSKSTPDMEQLRLLEERAKSIYLAAADREIRTPLNAIMGMLESLEISGLDKRQIKIVGTLRESTEVLQRIIDDILEVSKIEAGRMVVNAAPASFAATLGRIVESLSESAKLKGVRFALKIDPALAPLLDFDSIRIRQLLFILLSNALRLVDGDQIGIRVSLVEDKGKSQRIRLELAYSAMWLQFRGQPDSDEPNVAFDPEQILARKLTEAMNGTLSFAHGAGRTATLLFEFPKAGDDSTTTLDGPLSTAAGLLLPKLAVRDVHRNDFRVLVAEDLQINQIVIGGQLGALGYQADFADNGEQALAMWQSGRYSLVICDCQMPVMDGYSFARRVREFEAQNPQLGRTPIIAYTAGAIHSVAETCQAAGMDYFLTKPVNLSALKRVFNTWGPKDKPESVAEREGTDALNVDSGEAPIDRDELNRHVVGDANVERELLAIYVVDTQRDSTRLNAAIESGDFPLMAQVLQRMQKSAQIVAAKSMVKMCERAQRTLERGVKGEIHERTLDVLREVDRLLKYLAAV
jgi:two-component system, NarL family, sensor histidine kinase EvgS